MRISADPKYFSGYQIKIKCCATCRVPLLATQSPPASNGSMQEACAGCGPASVPFTPQTFFTVPQVLAELKDNRAREHFEKLGLLSGVKIEVRSPDAASLSHGMQS